MSVKDFDLHYLRRQIETAPPPAPRAIGIDVLSMGRANKYRLIVSDLDLGRPVWVDDGGRGEADLDKFFKALGEQTGARIELADMDMWEPFRKSVVKNAPQARIVHDEFHVMRQLSKCLDDIWRQEHKRLRQEDRGYVKGRRYSLLSRRENLNLDGSKALKKRLQANRRLHTAYVLHDTFRQFWNCRKEADALAFFSRWQEGLRRQGLEPYLKFALLVESHWEGIVAFLHPDHTIRPGLVEDINGKILDLSTRIDENVAEEALKLNIVAAFLPPLPEDAAEAAPIPGDAEKPPPPPAETALQQRQRALQSWFSLLCQMLPNVSMGIVAELQSGTELSQRIRWPADATPGDELLRVARGAVERAAPLIRGPIFAHPLRIDGRLFAVAVIALDVGEAQQAVVQQLLRWGEQWLQLLLGSGAGGELETDVVNLRAAILPALDLVLYAQPLQAAVLAASNQVAALFACERVTLGLVQGKRLRVRGISHATEFDPRTELIRGLEAAMEEVRSCGRLSLWPPGADEKAPALERLQASSGERALCAVPLSGLQRVIGVLLCERPAGRQFTPSEQEHLLTIGRLLGPVLELKRDQSAALPKRAALALERSLQRLVKPG